jgi:hypothetical protein
MALGALRVINKVIKKRKVVAQSDGWAKVR